MGKSYICTNKTNYMKKTWKKWSSKDIELLEYHWENSTMDVLLNTFEGRSYASLMCKAREVGIKSKIQRSRKGSFDFLDTLTTKSVYWWGFIMADGYISPKGELSITINNRDTEYLRVLANYLNTTLDFYKQFTRLRLQSKVFGEKWLRLLSINSPKTYTPPDLSIFLTKDNLLPFFIGLVDGDGCIWDSKNWVSLRVELHGNWFGTLEDISRKLREYYNIESKVRMTKRGYSKIDINTKKDLKILRDYIHNVDYLERKWIKTEKL